VAHLAGSRTSSAIAPTVSSIGTGVDAVLVVEVDHVDAEPLQRCVAALAHVVGRPFRPKKAGVAGADDAELRRDGGLSRRPRTAAHQPLVGVRPVHVGGVEHRDAELERPVNGRDGLTLVGGP
jgi:hypothetical protein